jgi:hypothetical protein
MPEHIEAALALCVRLVNQIPAPGIRRRHMEAYQTIETALGELYAAQEQAKDSKRAGNRRTRK